MLRQQALERIRDYYEGKDYIAPGGPASLAAIPEDLEPGVQGQDGKILKMEQLRGMVRSENEKPVSVRSKSLPQWEDWLAQLDGLEALLRAGRYVEHTPTTIPADWSSYVNALSDDEKDLGWVTYDQAFDAMSIDFMAPILRGVLSLNLDRGDSLARFWTHRYRWYGTTDESGAPLPDGKDASALPLAIFNACDVSRGARLAIGCPRLPPDIWRTPYKNRTGWGRPESLSEFDTTFQLSLARAVRLSSNFPYGFRVNELPLRLPEDSHGALLHVLDGGVVDNTGLDTLFALFDALEYFENRPPGTDELDDYRRQAHTILTLLRVRGTLLVEIDSGTKPTGAPLDPFKQGAVEPLRALDNAAYTSATRARLFYLDEIGKILRGERTNRTAREEAKADPHPPRASGKGAAGLHWQYCFQGNHETAHGNGDPRDEVMTAWALGPTDKAKIVGRFLIELALWNRKWPELRDRFQVREVQKQQAALRLPSQQQKADKAPVMLLQLSDQEMRHLNAELATKLPEIGDLQREVDATQSVLKQYFDQPRKGK